MSTGEAAFVRVGRALPETASDRQTERGALEANIRGGDDAVEEDKLEKLELRNLSSMRVSNRVIPPPDNSSLLATASTNPEGPLRSAQVRAYEYRA